MASTHTRDLPEEFLAATRKSQEVMIRAIRTWVETVRAVTPKLPSVYAPLSDRLPRLPSVSVSLADRLPAPEDVVASGYDFAEHLLAVQRKFAEDLLEVTEPLLPGNTRRAWQEATRSAPATAAQKTVAVTRTAVAVPVQAAHQVVVKAAPKPEPAAPEPAAPEPAAPKAPAAAARKAPAAKAAPKPAARKPAAPKPAAPKPAAPKPPAPRRAPKSTGPR